MAGIRPDDMFYSTWLNTAQDRDPAGRRAAAAAREPDHADGRRPDAAAALLVPAARREGGRRDERRRPLARQRSGRDRVRVRPLQGAEPGRLQRRRRGSASARPRTSTRTARSRMRRRPPTSRTASRSGSTRVVDSCPTAAISAASSPRYFDTQLGALAGPVHEHPGTGTSRTHCVYWPDWSSNATVELAHGIRMDANYYHYPGALDRREARLHERRRLPDALRRHSTGRRSTSGSRTRT